MAECVKCKEDSKELTNKLSEKGLRKLKKAAKDAEKDLSEDYPELVLRCDIHLSCRKAIIEDYERIAKNPEETQPKVWD